MVVRFFLAPRNTNCGHMPVQFYDTVSIHGPVAIEGNLTGIDASVSVTGNVAGITAPVGVSGNIEGITANVSTVVLGNVGGITAPVSVSGNIEGITANVSTFVLGNVAGITANVSTVVLGNVAGITSKVTVVGNGGTIGYVSSRDTGHDDAFGRLRVSNPDVISSFKRVGATPDLRMTTSVSGSGAITFDANLAATRMTVGSAVGTTVRQTMSRGIYQPGRSLLLYQTFVMAPARSNLTQQVGYFDTQNGIFLRVSNNATSIVRRSFATGAVTEEVVPQSSWNVDKMDGTGVSGIAANLQLSQNLAMDLEWLGVGRVRAGFVIGGEMFVAHQFLNTNRLDRVYMSNPNLPVRWENYSTGAIAGVANLDAICYSLMSEGGFDITGVQMCSDTSNVAVTLTSWQSKELMAIRIRADCTSYVTSYLESLTIMNTSAGAFRWRIVVNPTATVAGTWANVDSFGSIMEVNKTRTVTIDTGAQVMAGYSPGSSALATLSGATPVVTMGTNLAGTTDVLSVVVTSLSNQNETYYASLGWRELY